MDLRFPEFMLWYFRKNFNELFLSLKNVILMNMGGTVMKTVETVKKNATNTTVPALQGVRQDGMVLVATNVSLRLLFQISFKNI